MSFFFFYRFLFCIQVRVAFFFLFRKKNRILRPIYLKCNHIWSELKDNHTISIIVLYIDRHFCTCPISVAIFTRWFFPQIIISFFTVTWNHLPHGHLHLSFTCLIASIKKINKSTLFGENTTRGHNFPGLILYTVQTCTYKECFC